MKQLTNLYFDKINNLVLVAKILFQCESNETLVSWISAPAVQTLSTLWDFIRDCRKLLVFVMLKYRRLISSVISSRCLSSLASVENKISEGHWRLRKELVFRFWSREMPLWWIYPASFHRGDDERALPNPCAQSKDGFGAPRTEMGHNFCL